MARGPYKVVACPSCRWLQVTTAEKATRCRRCGRQIDLTHVKPLAVAKTAQEAREKLLKVKARLLRQQAAS